MSAEAPRPNFETIKRRIGSDHNEYFDRAEVGNQLEALIEEFGIQEDSSRMTRPVSVDDEGTIIQAHESKIEGSKTVVVTMEYIDPRSKNILRKPIFEINGPEVLNDRGQQLRGAEVQEAVAIIRFMREHLARTTTPVAQS